MATKRSPKYEVFMKEELNCNVKVNDYYYNYYLYFGKEYNNSNHKLRHN